ncbi:MULTISPECIES: hypothetical protein [unclassified Streptomyces]|uniref:hypothetical protein n=1 Tax=unclassified Streptomyces TaxID=2593676 RepID=UPI0006F97CDC|nr:MULTISPECIES: hypothetical protein [unclassified Streptomyces]KQX57506.1 hypothetical protein ASD33_27875 [Streptomyces sp. Root1304]KRA98879.1 hypothetical protein ASE09_24685 [Streptomyces sp. Root66D1]
MLRPSPAPAPALRSVLAALGSPTAVREARTPALRAAQGTLSPEHPLPVHILGVSGAPGHPPRARLAGWRFLISDGDRAIAAADTMLTPDGWSFSHFFEGPYVAATERALLQAEALPGAYQPRLLSVPQLYMLTLWLHAEPEEDGATPAPAAADLMVPLAPAPPGIAAHRAYQVADLLPVLRTRLAPPPLLGSAAPA